MPTFTEIDNSLKVFLLFNTLYIKTPLYFQRSKSSFQSRPIVQSQRGLRGRGWGEEDVRRVAEVRHQEQEIHGNRSVQIFVLGTRLSSVWNGQKIEATKFG